MEFNLSQLYKFKNKQKYKNYNTRAKFVSHFDIPGNDEGQVYIMFDKKRVSNAIKAFRAAKNKKEHIKHLAFLLNSFSPVNASAIMNQDGLEDWQKAKLQKFIGVEKYEKYLKGTGFQYEQFREEIKALNYDDDELAKIFKKYKRDFLTLLSNATDFLNDVLAEKRSFGLVEEKFKRRYLNIVKAGSRARPQNSVLKAKVTALEYLRSEEAYKEVIKNIKNFDSYQDAKKQEKLEEGFSDRLRAVNEAFFVYTGMNLMKLNSVNTFVGEVNVYPMESYIFNDRDVKSFKGSLNKLKSNPDVKRIYATTALKREEFAVSWAGSSSALQNTAELDAEFFKANNIKDQIVRIKELIKGGKKAPKREEDPEPRVASRGAKGRSRRVRRTGPTYANKYNIRKAPKDRWIGGYQDKLKSFYEKNAATKAIAKEINNKDPGKLTDGRYGYRTHYVTIKAAENIISQLDKFLKSKAPAKPAATPAAKPAAAKPAAAPAAKPAPAPAAKPAAQERRIKQLSKLLETKLVGSELNLFNEQDTPASEAKKKKELQGLLAKLQQIKKRLADKYDKDTRPDQDKFVQGEDLAEFNKILSMLSWNANGQIDFNKVYNKMQPAVAATKEPATEKEKIAQVARTIRGTCWYSFDPNTGGIRSGTPIAVWAAAGADFEEWYKKIVELFNYEGASSQFNYKSGAAAQGRLRGAPDKLNDNKTQSISLDCLSVFMTKIADNFRRNGVEIAIPQFVTAGKDEAKKKAVLTGAKYFLTDKGAYEGSVAHGLEQILNKVIAIIPSFKRGQIQKAMKTLVSEKASDEAKNAAAEVIARARRNEKAVAANAQRAKARAATKPAPAEVAAKGTAAQARSKPLDVNTIANMFVKRANKLATFKEEIIKAGTPGKANTPEVKKLAKEVFVTNEPTTEQINMVNAAITKARNEIIRASAPATAKPAATKPATAQPAPAAAKPQKESLKQKREKLLNEAIFKKLVK